MKPVRIVLADDHPLIREAIGNLLRHEPEFELVGEASNGRECLALVNDLKPDILVLDIAMPEINGESVARQVRDCCPEVKIIALSGYTDRQFVRAMTKAGAKAYVVKAASGRDLVQALRAVASGKSYLSPEITGAVMTQWGDDPQRTGAAAHTSLGKREEQVLKLIAEGNRSSAIATIMGISVATVDAHRRNILRKLQLHSVADLTRYALRRGIIEV
jgi:DNA-binding NarL/FixJ family response regulator